MDCGHAADSRVVLCMDAMVHHACLHGMPTWDDWSVNGVLQACTCDRKQVCISCPIPVAIVCKRRLLKTWHSGGVATEFSPPHCWRHVRPCASCDSRAVPGPSGFPTICLMHARMMRKSSASNIQHANASKKPQLQVAMLAAASAESAGAVCCLVHLVVTVVQPASAAQAPQEKGRKARVIHE